jgi:hypothetical protein
VFPITVLITSEFERVINRRSLVVMRLRRGLSLLLLIGCASDPAAAQRGDPNLPNPALTPGDRFEVTQEDVCGVDYSSPASRIPITLKRQTFDRYGLKPGAIGFNVDHLIPTSLGGSNSPKNLWPQSLSGEWNYNMKNSLERTLKKMVCRKEIALETAQKEIAADWISAYKKYMQKRRKGRDRNPA